jgi:putative transposase
VINAICSEQKGGAFVVHEMAPAEEEKLQLIWVDQGYQGENFARVIEQLCGAKVRCQAL